MFMKILKSMAPVALLALVAAPAAAQPGAPSLEIRITNSAPPKVRHESTPPRPDSHAVWVKGYWHWAGKQWDWMPGRWERATNPHSHWVAARYKREGNVWRYEPPHWSHERVVQGDEYRHWQEEHHHN